MNWDKRHRSHVNRQHFRLRSFALLCLDFFVVWSIRGSKVTFSLTQNFRFYISVSISSSVISSKADSPSSNTRISEHLFAEMFNPFDLPTGISEVSKCDVKQFSNFSFPRKFPYHLRWFQGCLTNCILLTLTHTKRKLEKHRNIFRFRRLETVKFITRPYNNVTKKINLFDIVSGSVAQSMINSIHDWRAILLQFCKFLVTNLVYIFQFCPSIELCKKNSIKISFS